MIPINKLTQDGDIIDNTLIYSSYFITGYTYGATITPFSNPLTEEVNVFYMVVQSGTYTNFGALVITEPGFIYFTKGVGYSFQAFSFTGSGIAGVTSINSLSGAITLTTDDIPEGSINKYFSGTVPTDISDLTDNEGLFPAKANLSDVLTKTNISEYEPSADYHPATKKFVDDSISNAISNLSNIGSANIALDIDWESATLPPIQTDPNVTDHIEDDTIHFTEDSIDKYTRTEVDSLIASLQSQISANSIIISNLDSASEDVVLSHIYNLSVHFTKESMYDYLVQNFDFSDIGQDTIAAMVGDRTYTEENYVTSNESITASIDALDMKLKEVADSSGGSSGGTNLTPPISFEFCVEPGYESSFTLDIYVAQAYTINTVVLEVDEGSLDDISISIDSVDLDEVSGISISSSKSILTPSSDNIASIGSRVTLEVGDSYTGTPSIIRGKIIVE